MSGPTGSLQILVGQSPRMEAGTSQNSTEHTGIMARETTVISEWTDSEGNNLLTTFNITEALLVTDLALILPDGVTGSTITLSSGSIWLFEI